MRLWGMKRLLGIWIRKAALVAQHPRPRAETVSKRAPTLINARIFTQSTTCIISASLLPWPGDYVILDRHIAQLILWYILFSQITLVDTSAAVSLVLECPSFRKQYMAHSEVNKAQTIFANCNMFAQTQGHDLQVQTRNISIKTMFFTSWEVEEDWTDGAAA